MSAPKLSVETPWAAEFHRQFRPGRFWRNVGPHERNRTRRNVIEKGLGLRLMSTERVERHSPVGLLTRLGDFLHGVVRAFSAKNIFAVGIGEVINLFGLPGPQVFEKGFEAFGRAGNLLGESARVAREIKRFGGQHAGSP